MFQVHHIAISVSNLEKTEQFYWFFGFKKVFYWNLDDDSLEISHLKLGNFILEVFCFRKYKKLPENSKNLETDLPEIWVKHFGLKVNDIEQIRDLLLKKWFADSLEIAKWRTGIKYFFIKDPDGMLLEIVEDNRDL